MLEHRFETDEWFYDGMKIVNVVHDFHRDGTMLSLVDDFGARMTVFLSDCDPRLDQIRQVSLAANYTSIYGVAVRSPRSLVKIAEKPREMVTERVQRRTSVIGRFGFGGRWSARISRRAA